MQKLPAAIVELLENTDLRLSEDISEAGAWLGLANQSGNTSSPKFRLPFWIFLSL